MTKPVDLLVVANVYVLKVLDYVTCREVTVYRCCGSDHECIMHACLNVHNMRCRSLAGDPQAFESSDNASSVELGVQVNILPLVATY